jgi:hypothetical protein
LFSKLQNELFRAPQASFRTAPAAVDHKTLFSRQTIHPAAPLATSKVESDEDAELQFVIVLFNSVRFPLVK